MSLATDLQRLHAAHANQLACLQALRITVVDDRPPDRDLALFDALGDTLDALAGSAEECCSSARRACEAGGSPLDRFTLERSLLDCARSQARLRERAWSELSRHDHVLDIASLARRYGGEWGAWVRGVFAGSDECERARQQVERAQIQAWGAWLEYFGGDTSALATTTPLAATIKEDAHVTE